MPDDLPDQSGALFSKMIAEDIAILSSSARQITRAKGESIFMQGDPSHAVYYLKEGIVKISRINADGRKLTIDLVEAGGFFGELCLAGEKERRTIAEAMVEASCDELDRKNIEAYMQKKPEFALKLIKMIGDRRLAMENLLEDMAFMEIPARVAALFLKYAEKDYVKIPLTHQEIADLTGSTRVSVSRCIAQMRKKGLIDTEGNRIRLINTGMLQDHAQYSAGFV